MDTTLRAVIAGLSFVLMVLSGIWLTRVGRPLNVGISTVHKLVGLGTGIFLIATLVQRSRAAPLDAAEWTAVVLTGLCFLAAVASGGFLSFERPAPVAVLRVHQIAPALIALSTAATLVLVLGG